MYQIQDRLTSTRSIDAGERYLEFALEILKRLFLEIANMETLVACVSFYLLS